MDPTNKWDTSVLSNEPAPSPPPSSTFLPTQTMTLAGALFAILVVVRPPILATNEDDELSLARCLATVVLLTLIAHLGNVFF